jgi:ABC-type nitrate/sulfonate/bicarbonate transport system permease component
VTDVLQSLQHVGVGFVLAVIIGTPLGLAIGTNRALAALFDPPIQFLKPIPPIAWIPLAILWFGIGDAPSYFLTMIAALFPIVLNVHQGVRGISAQHFAVARCFETPRAMVLRFVIWPAALPFAMSGYRIGLAVAWMTVVGAEMIAAPSGLGHLIHESQDLLQTDKVIAGMFAIGFIGVAADYGLRRLESRLVPWR